MIRQATVEDICGIKTIVARFAKEIGETRQVADMVISNIESGVSSCMVAEKSGEIVGALGFILSGSVAVGDFFYIIPEMRQTKTGGLLLRKGTKYAKENGARRIFIATRESMAERYEHIGFKRTKVIVEKEI